MAQAKKTAAKKKATKKKTTKKAARRSASSRIREEEESHPSNGQALQARLIAHRLEPNVIGEESPQMVQLAVEYLMGVVSAYRDEMGALPDDGELSQRHIGIAAIADQAKSAVGELGKLFSVTALRLHEGGGRFEGGVLQVRFKPVAGKRSPKWKDVAIEHAEKLAQAQGKPFSAKTFEERVKTSTAPSPDSLKAEIVEAG